ncbi:MAG TPA: DNA-binding domain-containing protein [Thermoanaerobaculia bacterium]|nr:DNA-binding domain-containing protein [Thermoanaerobaculia bacterium]
MSRRRGAVPAGSAPPLDVVQQWFQAVITHPGGVAGGVASRESQGLIRMRREELVKLVSRSRNLTAEERLSIYANAYYARLLECLADCFPVLARVLGEEVFASFAFEYLQQYPSRSYTLDHLGEHFPRFLEETRPDRLARRGSGGTAEREAAADGEREAAADGGAGGQAEAATGEDDAPSWPDFLIDLATFELAIAKVFDGPGVEHQPLLRTEDLATLAPERFAAARLLTVPCLRLLRFRYPVNAFFTRVREAAAEEELLPPPPATEYVALSRRDFVVRRYELSELEHTLLSALQAGTPVGEAIAVAAAASDLDDDQLAGSIRSAFTTWAAEGMILSLADPVGEVGEMGEVGEE